MLPWPKTLRPFDKRKDLPVHKFVELVETNPDGASRKVEGFSTKWYGQVSSDRS